MINFYHCDCNDFMKDKPDNYYDLVIVDPPYFEGPNQGKKYYQGKNNLAKCKEYKELKKWDIPNEKYFDELFRISKNQIIWGVNHYNYIFLGGRIIWLKMEKETPFSTCEIAYNSMNIKITHFKYLWNGFWQENMKNKEIRIHPTQKPVQLYKWLLQNYAKKGDKIFDSHGGSMSSAIACDMEGFDLDICEIDKEYFDAGKKRFETYKLQLKLF